ncbi:MAG: luciferase [Myxococcales bacterium]|nr:luciferase [Myxococcales bacterium]|tara:strand:+ start:1299 stop:2525 length:1227 start_codon:yes stop_codon:yes gene_type:complete
MQYNIFFSISQTPVDGFMPSESEMFGNFFEQVEAADALGYDVGWIAESHLSSEIQKTNRQPVIPHWKGEVGLNVDFLQLAHQVYQRTHRIEVGSAIMNILCMGGPVTHAERVAAFCGLHGLNPEEKRRIHVGFAAGRFDFMNRATGVVPRTPAEIAAGRVFKNKVFSEAAEIFLRLLKGQTLSSGDIPSRSFSRGDFRSDEDWQRVQTAAESTADEITIPNQWNFEQLKIIPQEWRRDLLQLVIGSHDPRQQEVVNELLPVQVFNLSITRADVIEATHERMRNAYHPDGGPWHRSYMPRTVMVFVNEQEGCSASERSSRAHQEAEKALSAYWTALEGTLDTEKVKKAANNAIIGNASEVADQIVERFHPDDRLMLWFDFFNHDSARVIENMTTFKTKVEPMVRERLQK